MKKPAGRWLPKPRKPHRCPVPSMWFQPMGREWECGECERRWRIGSDPHFYQGHMKEWQRLYGHGPTE